MKCRVYENSQNPKIDKEKNIESIFVNKSIYNHIFKDI